MIFNAKVPRNWIRNILILMYSDVASIWYCIEKYYVVDLFRLEFFSGLGDLLDGESSIEGQL